MALIGAIFNYLGTHAARLALVTTGIPAGSTWTETDSNPVGAEYTWDGAAWFLSGIGGSGGGAISLETAPRSTGVVTLNNRNTTGSDAALDVSGYGMALLSVSANAGSTVQFEASVDGSTYIAIKGHQRGAGTFASTTTGTGVFEFDVRGFSTFRANITVAAGAVTATAYGTDAPGSGTLIDVEGAAASGAADLGNPVKTGGKYNATNITVTDGQRVDDQATVNGFKRTDLGTLLAGEDLTLNRLNVAPKYNYTGITTQTTTVVKSGAGILHAITINKPLASGVVTVDDATSATTPTIGVLTLPATLLQDGPKVWLLDVAFSTGLTIVTSGATQDITVSWL